MPSPKIQILEAFKAFCDLTVAALPVNERFTVRHRRHRESSSEEWPALEIQFVSIDPAGGGNGADDGLSMAEEVWALKLNLKAVAVLPAEDAGDHTGLATPDAMIQIILEAIFSDGVNPEQFGGLVWDVSYDGTVEHDDDSNSDRGELAEGLTLMYRVRRENPNHILMG